MKSSMRSKPWEQIIGWTVFGTLLTGIFILSGPLLSVCHFLWVAWSVGCISYSIACKSKRSESDLIKNAIVISVVVAFFAMVFHGASTVEDDGYSRDDGFAVTMEDRCVTAVKVFVVFCLASVGGIKLRAFASADDRPPADEPRVPVVPQVPVKQTTSQFQPMQPQPLLDSDGNLPGQIRPSENLKELFRALDEASTKPHPRATPSSTHGKN